MPVVVDELAVEPAIGGVLSELKTMPVVVDELAEEPASGSLQGQL